MLYKGEKSSEEIEKIVLSDINMNSKSLQEGVQHLIEWISKQPHLPKVTDNNLLKAFIIGSKSVERAKERIDKYYVARSKHAHAFANRDPRNIKWECVQNVFILPGLLPTGHHIQMIISPDKAQLEKYEFVETAKVFFYLFDLTFKKIPINAGQYLICDCKNMSMEFLTKFITSFTAAAFEIYQNTLPLRIASIICFNVSPVAEIFVNKILKALYSEKLRERIHAHKEDHTVLSKYFPLELLPEDYGGKNPSVKQLREITKKDFEEQRDWFMTEGSQGANLALRPKKANDDEEQLQGTFRKLEID